MRILLVKTSSMGDLVHNLPVVSDILAHFPDAEIDWVVEEDYVSIPALHPGVKRIIPFALRRWRRTLWSPKSWREFAAFRRQLQQQQYDVVLDSQGLLKSALISWQARGRRKGFAADSAREPLAAHCYDQRFSLPRQLHAIERNRRLAALALDYSLAESALDYGVALPQQAADCPPQGNYAVLLSATSRADKEWPEPAWCELIAQLNQSGLICLLPSGNAREYQRCQRLAQGAQQAQALSPQPLTTVCQLLAAAQLVVGVDTGLVHLATALGRPTVALYAASDPRLTGVMAATASPAAAINLGAPGKPPSSAEVIAAAMRLLPGD